jgi:hypothetical protein
MGTSLIDKGMFGAGLMLIILNVAVLAPMATGGVVSAVEEATATKPLDDICSDSSCKFANADWESSTSPRNFYAWDITNLEEVIAGGEPIYQQVGPVTYDVTSEREIISHDAENGSITYRQFTIYECAEDTEYSCDTEMTNINIAFTPQVIGATHTAIGAVMDITKTGFTSGILGIQIDQFQAGHNTSNYLKYNIKNLRPLEAMFDKTAELNIMDGMFDAFNPVYGENFLDENISYFNATGFEPLWEEVNLRYTFENATGPDGEDLGLLNNLGPLVYASMGEPGSLDELLYDSANSVTMRRANIWGFAHPTDANITLARDWTLYGGMGKLMLDYGGADEDWSTDTTGDSVDASQRVMNLLGLEIDNDIAMNLLFGGDETSEPTGILAVSDSGTSFGLATFLEMDPTEALEFYNLNQTQYQTFFNWSDSWISDSEGLPLILVGGEGYITASEFVNRSFGGEDPINGGYLDNSLNMGGAWGTAFTGSAGKDPIALTPEQSANLLFGPHGLTTQQGVAFFLYGELSGKTPPVNMDTLERAPAVEWNTSLVAELYGIDDDAASALRYLLMGPLFGTLIPGFLEDVFGTGPYLTQSVNNWLLGWHDPVVAYLNSGDSSNMSVGWTSLESNKTYFGSGGVSNGDGTIYTICTGEVDTCDKGEMLFEDGNDQLSWRDDVKENATFGLITPESRAGATGGFITGDGDKIDLSGYGVVGLKCEGESVLKGIPVNECTATMPVLSRPIQAKLLNTDSLLDATPGALPIYFGSDVLIKVEKVSGAIIAGESTSMFYIDTRPRTQQQTPPIMDDMQPVFMIKTSAEIGDEDAAALKSKIITNQDPMMYWTNFDHPADYATIAIYVIGLILILNFTRVTLKGRDTKEEPVTEWTDDSAKV